MVKLRTDYITRLMPEDIDTLTTDDKLYIEAKDGQYSFDEKIQIQNDNDSISIIYNDMVYVFAFDSVKMYRVREKPKYFCPINEQAGNFGNFVWGLVFGVMIMCIMLSINGV